MRLRRVAQRHGLRHQDDAIPTSSGLCVGYRAAVLHAATQNSSTKIEWTRIVTMPLFGL